VQTALSQGLTSFSSPCPPASWNTDDVKGRVAYIHTRDDRAVPYEAQAAMVQATGVEWITREVDCGHGAQLAKPEEVRDVILGVAGLWV
jgi:pimeloyl-ACP methyl ester carboxylesterase